MKGSSSKDFAYAMTPLKILSIPVGTWPLQDYNFFSFLRAALTIALLLLMLLIEFTEIYLDGSDAEKNLDTLVLSACGILSVVKVFFFRMRRMGLVTNFTSAVKDYDELVGTEKRAIVRRHAFMGRVACATVIFGSYFGSTLFMSVPMLVGAEEKETGKNVTAEEEPGYPIPSANTLAMVNMPQKVYPLIFVVEYLMLLLISTSNLGSDSLFFGIVFHLCGQAEVLKMEFTELANEKERTRERFVALTKRHIHLLQLADLLNETVSAILVVQLLTSCILICSTGFQFILSLSDGNIVIAVKTFISMSTLLAQLFAYSYIGDYMQQQLEGIGTSVYFCRWYDLPRPVAKDIIFTIMETQRPVHLTAGDFFVVNMETYMSILKTSMSYLSVLRVMVTT